MAIALIHILRLAAGRHSRGEQSPIDAAIALPVHVTLPLRPTFRLTT